MATKQKHKERSHRSYRQNKNMAIQFFSSNLWIKWEKMFRSMNN